MSRRNLQPIPGDRRGDETIDEIIGRPAGEKLVRKVEPISYEPISFYNPFVKFFTSLECVLNKWK